ncbi:MAG TPA: anhydro-N-acetylmuramic acid kinase [Woeseiaceae bacterium]|nr:anhydro-N-acetylmuramic acid kinase [Woeseiaceae bacterium]
MATEQAPLYIGLISGTSMDGVDAALVSLGAHRCNVRATLSAPYEPELRERLYAASREPAAFAVDRLGHLDHWVGEAFRDAALALLRDSGVPASAITAIGSHGQTVRHQPRAARPFTLQLGDPHIIAAGSGVTTVADFRRRDIALGGEGAPLAPAFHHWLWGKSERGTAVLNVGGFANLTILPADESAVSGFDTGPGNSLMDGWCARHLGKAYDEDGAWAASGKVSDALLEQLLGDEYFRRPAPKSTGFEHFNAAWLDAHLAAAGTLPAADVQATLCEFTARSIADALGRYAPQTERLLVCGGGAHNGQLLLRLAAKLPRATVQTTDAVGIGPDWVEAATFAWLAARCLNRETGNLPAVTGAREAAILGSIFPGRS